MKIFPSLISSDLLNIQTTIKNLDPNCDGYHIDIMDDHFVPNLTWGPAFVRAISSVTNLPLDVHLMVDNPVAWVDRLNLKPKDLFVFHIETLDSDEEIKDLIKTVKIIGCKAGIALNPETPVEKVFDYLALIDHVLVMSVKPGFSGQKFMESVLSKVKVLNQKRHDMNLPFDIGMDGGIDKSNIAMISELSVDQVGVASAIFSHKDYVAALQDLY